MPDSLATPGEPRIEAFYRDRLAEQLDGRTEVRLPFGICDVLAGDRVFEVEPISPAGRFNEGVRQALHYGAMSGLRAALAVFGRADCLPEAFSRVQELPGGALELWFYADGRFAQVTSAAQAQALVPEPAPAAPAASPPKPFRIPPPEAAPVPVPHAEPRRRCITCGDEPCPPPPAPPPPPAGLSGKELRQWHLDYAIAHSVDHAPPLTDFQVNELARLLFSGPRPAREVGSPS